MNDITPPRDKAPMGDRSPANDGTRRNDGSTDDTRGRSAQDAAPDLPVLQDSAVARIEAAVLHEISAEGRGRPKPAPRARARRRWLTGAGIAAAFVVGILVAPPIVSAVSGGAMSTAGSADTPTGIAVEDSRGGAVEQSEPGGLADTAESSALAPGAVDSADREIVSTAAATLEVKDIAAAATSITALAESYGGYVESTEIGMSAVDDGVSDPAPADTGHGWIGIRVPSADLTAVMAALADSGDVLSSSVSRQDVTSTAVDLRARVDALKASVQRLTELMSQTGTVAELIEAEVALTDRQAQLEASQQQLAALDDQVAMSSLQVQLTRSDPPAAAPAGFADGLVAGWNGLVASLNALIVALGFLLPWIAVGTVFVLVLVLVRRARRARRARRSPGTSAAES